MAIQYKYSFSVSPKVAVGNDPVNVSFTLVNTSDGSGIPAGTTVRFNVTGNVEGVIGRSVLRTLDGDGTFTETLNPRGEDSGSFGVSVTHAFVAGEDDVRNINGADASIQYLGDTGGMCSISPTDGYPTDVGVFKSSILQGQSGAFCIHGTAGANGPLGYDYGISTSAITPGNADDSAFRKLTGENQDINTGSVRRTSGELPPPGPNDIATFGFSTANRLVDLVDDVTVTYHLQFTPSSQAIADGDNGQLMAEIVVRAIENNVVTSGGNTSNGTSNTGFQRFTTSDDNFNVNIANRNLDNSDAPATVESTITLTGDNSELGGAFVEEGITLVDDSSDPIPSTSEVVTSSNSEFIIDNDSDPETVVEEPIVSGDGTKTKTGTGTSRSSRRNSYTGPTNVQAGTQEFEEGGQGNTQKINVSDNANLTFDNRSNGPITIEEDVVTTIAGTTVMEFNGGVTNYLGSITGDSSSLIRIRTQDNGGVRFVNHNTNFEGNIIVEERAELMFDPTNNEDTVHSGNLEIFGALKGQGVIQGNVTIKRGGDLLVGAEVGTQMRITGNLILEGGSSTYISLLQNSNDKLVVDGNITIAGDLYLYAFDNNLMTGPYEIITYGTRTADSEFSSITAPDDNDPTNGVNIPDANKPTTPDYSVAGKVTIT